MADDSKPHEDDLRHDDHERLRECLSYDSETGILRWRIRATSHVAVGDIAGSLDRRGYRWIRLDGKLMLAHRVAWALHYGDWPERDLDHKNRDKSDNRIDNLRLATRPQNCANTPPKNKSMLPKGCYQLKGRARWYSQIRAGGEIKRLGTFATVQEAAAAFEREHRAIHGDFSVCEA